MQQHTKEHGQIEQTQLEAEIQEFRDRITGTTDQPGLTHLVDEIMVRGQNADSPQGQAAAIELSGLAARHALDIGATHASALALSGSVILAKDLQRMTGHVIGNFGGLEKPPPPPPPAG